MLDVHILVSADTPKEWVAQCLASVLVAQDRAGYPVHVHVVPGVPGHIGRARAVGFAQGNQPYATYVDDDDWVEPQAFACLHASMLANALAIYTREIIWKNGKGAPFDGRQALRVFRRDVMDGFDHEAWPILGDSALQNQADTFGPGVELVDRVYHYRLRQDGSRRLYAQHADLVRSLHG